MSEARIAVAASVSSQGVVWDELDRPSSWVHERTKGPESRALAAPGAGEEPDEIVSFPEWREGWAGPRHRQRGEEQASVRTILGGLRAGKFTGRPLPGGLIGWDQNRAGVARS